MANHYVKQDTQGRITKGYTDDFEYPEPGDVCVLKDGGRHFQIDGECNPPLRDRQGRYRYKLVDGDVVVRTLEELAGDALPIPVSSDAERLDALESLIVDTQYQLALTQLGLTGGV